MHPFDGETYKHQKDWIISDLKKGNLLCLTIASEDGKKWYLTKFGNHFDLTDTKMKQMMDMAQFMMIEASKCFEYEYEICAHRFSEKDFDKDNGYWKALVGEKVKGLKKSIDFGDMPVDKEQFEKNVKKLVEKRDIKFKTPTFKKIKRKLRS